jgi:hypothetical protein
MEDNNQRKEESLRRDSAFHGIAAGAGQDVPLQADEQGQHRQD